MSGDLTGDLTSCDLRENVIDRRLSLEHEVMATDDVDSSKLVLQRSDCTRRTEPTFVLMARDFVDPIIRCFIDASSYSSSCVQSVTKCAVMWSHQFK